MYQKFKILLSLAMIAVISFACSSGGDNTGQVSTTSEKPTATVSLPAEEVENQPAAELDLSLLDEPVQVPEGGFSFRPAKGYHVDVSGGTVSMLAPGADPDLGPVIQIMGIMSDQETSVDQLHEQLLTGLPMEAGVPVEVSIDGQTGITVQVSSAEPDKIGQFLFVVVDGYQQFIMMVGSPGADWESFLPIVEAVQASIEFTEVTQAAPSSSLSSGRYVYTNRNVIRDLAEKDGIIYAATLGGLQTWRMSSGSSFVSVPTEGMGNISANAVAYCEIPEPRILVGTLQGISIFDFSSGRWEQRNLFPEDSKISTSKIERIYCDQANNRILVGYTGLGVLDLNTGEFAHYTDQNGLLWNSITDITVNGQDIWVATGYKGIAKISNGMITTFTEAEGMPDDATTALEFSPNGTLWVGASSGLMAYRGGAWEMFGSDTDANLSSINEIEIVSDEAIWVATASLGNGRLCLYEVPTASCLEDFADADYAPIVALTSTSISEPIYGTSKGITLLKSGSPTLEQLKTSSQLVSNYVDSLAVSPDGMLWIGTDGGVQVLDPANPAQPWNTYLQKEQTGMGGNWASGIAFSTDGGAWIAMINGSASHYTGGQWQAFSDIYSYYTSAVDAQGRAWFADDGKGIIVVDAQGNQVMTLTAADGLPSDNVQALLLDASGTMWIGTNQGLAKYANNTLSVVFGKDSKDLPNVYIRALALDPNGFLLIGTFTGVSRYDGQNATTLVDFLKDGFSDARLTTLACDSTGGLWVGTDKGLLHDGQTGWSMMNTTNGLLTNYVSALTVDQFDAVWVGGGGSNFDGGGLLQIVP